MSIENVPCLIFFEQPMWRESDWPTTSIHVIGGSRRVEQWLHLSTYDRLFVPPETSVAPLWNVAFPDRQSCVYFIIVFICSIRKCLPARISEPDRETSSQGRSRARLDGKITHLHFVTSSGHLVASGHVSKGRDHDFVIIFIGKCLYN